MNKTTITIMIVILVGLVAYSIYQLNKVEGKINKAGKMIEGEKQQSPSAPTSVSARDFVEELKNKLNNSEVTVNFVEQSKPQA